ncbi:MAG: PhzF family phenazine biosynthesis protein [Pseudonocardia sp.]|nr:PhzF family phenazine biosynthesis protein [Pseudonocardia sp.]
MRRADPHRRQRVAAGVAAAGVPYAFLAVVPDAVARAVPDAAALRASSRDVGGAAGGLVGFVVVAFDRHGRHAHTRMFAPEVGVVEDPATGSAAVALGVLLVDRGVLAGDRADRVHRRPGRGDRPAVAAGGAGPCPRRRGRRDRRARRRHHRRPW